MRQPHFRNMNDLSNLLRFLRRRHRLQEHFQQAFLEEQAGYLSEYSRLNARYCNHAYNLLGIFKPHHSQDIQKQGETGPINTILGAKFITSFWDHAPVHNASPGLWRFSVDLHYLLYRSLRQCRPKSQHAYTLQELAEMALFRLNASQSTLLAKQAMEMEVLSRANRGMHYIPAPLIELTLPLVTLPSEDRYFESLDYLGRSIPTVRDPYLCTVLCAIFREAIASIVERSNHVVRSTHL